MKPVIGVLLRGEVTNENNHVMVLYKNIYDTIKSYNCTVIGIDEFHEEVLKICDGIIAQGGDEVREEDRSIIMYARKHDIPFLGICLGMQEMSVFMNGVLDDFNDSFHKQIKDYVHDVKIQKDSFLYKILEKEKIKVNSRHKSYVTKTDLEKSAYYEDTIEAVEDSNRKFFLGVQWHPESMISYDDDARKLMDYFFSIVKGNHHDD